MRWCKKMFVRRKKSSANIFYNVRKVENIGVIIHPVPNKDFNLVSILFYLYMFHCTCMYLFLYVRFFNDFLYLLKPCTKGFFQSMCLGKKKEKPYFF